MFTILNILNAHSKEGTLNTIVIIRACQRELYLILEAHLHYLQYVSSEVDRGFEPRLGHSNDLYNFYFVFLR